MVICPIFGRCFSNSTSTGGLPGLLLMAQLLDIRHHVLKRLAADAVRQRQFGCRFDIVLGHLCAVVISGDGLGCFRDDDIARCPSTPTSGQ